MSTELGTTLINAYSKGGSEGMRHVERILQSMLVCLSTLHCRAPVAVRRQLTSRLSSQERTAAEEAGAANAATLNSVLAAHRQLGLHSCGASAVLLQVPLNRPL